MRGGQTSSYSSSSISSASSTSVCFTRTYCAVAFLTGCCIRSCSTFLPSSLRVFSFTASLNICSKTEYILDRTKNQVFLEQIFQISYDLVAVGMRRIPARRHTKVPLVGTLSGVDFGETAWKLVS